ncbi:SDR family NAD(P)-dependent oxidoreductase [Mariniflexile litorale]|uniref:SDR family NAD(P)-dependent oxidoreductase n=1 Tax=Mariniflexile litorale TaxID=3045158 RepID=A0AAU7EDM3_9FLAO|nr:SDR family NAD(P)-dependent oxidoreductase [Mariniflexile sp. KMM 9835]MDQ8212840.1 SDR family NAD(P)-dependent oxidoreductase [Mariniflexile sp. KMM 9835]
MSEGVFRGCYYNHKGEEITRCFIQENSIMCDYVNFETNAVSSGYLQVCTDGFATAKLLLQKGYYVYLGSRNSQNGAAAVEKLKTENLTNVEYIQLDVTDNNSVKTASE